MSVKRSPTLKDIARMAGVSPITASRALANRPEVKAETSLRVHRAAKRLNYVHNHTARAFSARGSKLIALIVPNVSNSVFASTIDGLNSVFSAAGYSLVIGYSGYSEKEEERLVRSLLGYRPDGVVLTGFTHSSVTRALLKRAGCPVVETWNIGPDPIDMAVGFSNYHAALAMTRYLIACGHEHLAYAGGTQVDNDRTRAREKAFRDALNSAGLPAREEWICSLPIELSSGVDLAQRFARDKQRPRAVFAASDIIASGFVLECTRLGLRIPHDIAIAGFDDTPLAVAIEPRLTTVRVPQREIGTTTAALMLARLDGTGPTSAAHDLGFEIIVRGSA